MEQRRICPYCMQELEAGEEQCPHCGRELAGRNPAGSLPAGTVLAGRYTVGDIQSVDGEGILYRGVENNGPFRVTIKEYMPLTLAAERGRDCILRPKPGSEVLFKTTRMDFADLYRFIQRITPTNGLEAVLDVLKRTTRSTPSWRTPAAVRSRMAGGARHRDVPAGLRHAGTGVQRGGGHASGGPRTPGHLPGQHPHHGQWPRPAHRLRDGGSAHGRQRSPRAAVRGLFRPGAVFHRRVRGPLHRRIQPRGGVLPDGLRAEPRPGGTAPRLRLQPQGPHGDAVGAGLRLRNAVSGPPAQAGGAHPDGAAAFRALSEREYAGGIVPQHGSAGPARPRAAGAESAREG